MSIKFRNYKKETDFDLIGKFLSEQYTTDNKDGNWLKPIWEFIHKHACVNMFQLEKSGIWEDNWKIVGIVHLESPFLGYVQIDIHHKYKFLRREILKYAEDNLFGKTSDGKSFLQVLICDTDNSFAQIAKSHGYQKQEDNAAVVMKYDIEYPFPEIKVPNNFNLISLKDEYNFETIHKGLWKAFEYPGEPPVDKSGDLPRLHSLTNYNRDITIMAKAPSGELASFCGMWYDDFTKVACVEPVATNPDFRLMGLGRSTVLEAIKRCGALGANVVYVYPDNKEFYKAIGFTTLHTIYPWIKYWNK